MKNLFIAVSLCFLLSACEDEKFECNQNTVFVNNDVQECGQSVITGYSHTGQSEDISMQIAGGYTVRMYKGDGLFEENVPYTPFSLTFSTLNAHYTNTVTFVKIDRVNKTISLKFNFHNEGAHNFQGYDVKAEGQASDMSYN